MCFDFWSEHFASKYFARSCLLLFTHPGVWRPLKIEEKSIIEHIHICLKATDGDALDKYNYICEERSWWWLERQQTETGPPAHKGIWDMLKCAWQTSGRSRRCSAWLKIITAKNSHGDVDVLFLFSLTWCWLRGAEILGFIHPEEDRTNMYSTCVQLPRDKILACRQH